MKKNNPSRDEKALARRAETISHTFRKNAWQQEREMEQFLKELGVNYLSQYPIGRYNADFFLPDLNLVLEVDSTQKWGVYRRTKAEERDEYLRARGYKVFRVCKTKLKNYDFKGWLQVQLSRFEQVGQPLLLASSN